MDCPLKGMNQPEKHPPRQGDTLPRVKGKSSPRLPHEHDESASSQNSEPQPVMKQAHADIERGLVDTDCAPVADEVYRRALQQGHSEAGIDKPGAKSK